MIQEPEFLQKRNNVSPYCMSITSKCNPCREHEGKCQGPGLTPKVTNSHLKKKRDNCSLRILLFTFSFFKVSTKCCLSLDSDFHFCRVSRVTFKFMSCLACSVVILFPNTRTKCWTRDRTSFCRVQWWSCCCGVLTTSEGSKS